MGKEIKTKVIVYKHILNGKELEGIHSRVVLNDSNPYYIEFFGVTGSIGESLCLPRKNIKIIETCFNSEYKRDN